MKWNEASTRKGLQYSGKCQPNIELAPITNYVLVFWRYVHVTPNTACTITLNGESGCLSSTLNHNNFEVPYSKEFLWGVNFRGQATPTIIVSHENLHWHKYGTRHTPSPTKIDYRACNCGHGNFLVYYFLGHNYPGLKFCAWE